MVSFLLLIGVAGVVCWLIVRTRNKLRRAADEALAREAAFVGGLSRAPDPVLPAAAAMAPAGAEPLPSVAAAPHLGAYLSALGAQAFRLLKAALPEHEIFPRGSLRSVLGPLAPGKDLDVDFVVCTADLRPVAVVDLMAPDDLPPVVTLKAERLAAAGVAYARWDGQALPTVAQVAEWVAPAKRAVGAASGRE